MRALITPLAALALSMMAGQTVMAQSTGSAGLSQFQAGYNGSRYTTAHNTSGSTRDTNGNRLVVNGLIQNGVSSYSSATAGVGSVSSGASSIGLGNLGSATAIGNSLNVVVQGNNNTVVVNSNQTNSGNIQAGTTLNRNPRD